MSTRIRSSSMGAIPRPKKHFTTRAGSVAVPTLDVRCACQFFQSESLLPERINPVGSRPSSSQGYHSGPISPDLTQPVLEPENVDPESEAAFTFGVVGLTDYYSGRPQSLVLSKVGDTNISTINRQQNVPSSNLEHNGSRPGLQEQEISHEPKGMDVLRQKDLSESVLLRRRSESTQRNLDNTGQQRDPSTSSILRRRFSEKNINNIQQKDPSKSSLLRRRMDSQGSLQQQSSTEEPLAKEPKIKESTPVREPAPAAQPLTNAERFMLSKSTLQMKPSIELSDLYRETMTFPESESKEQSKPKTIDVGIVDLMALGTSYIQKGVINGNDKRVENDEEDVDERPLNVDEVVNGSQDMLPSMANGQKSPFSPTSSALVHIGQNIYIEEPGQSSEQSSMPVKVERPSRRDYPDKKHKNANDDVNKTKMVDEGHDNISGTLLPRDLREQSTVSTNSQTAKPDNLITLKESKRDLSTSSILQRKYIRSQSIDSPTDAAASTPISIRQRDPSSSSLLRRRYGQGVEETISDKKPNAEELISSATELIENPTVNLSSEVLDSPSEIVSETTFKDISSVPNSMGRFREKMDWIERTYNTRDHEYEPIGESNDTVPVDSASSLQDSPPQLSHELKTETQEDNSADAASITSHERKLLGATNAIDEEGDLQQDHIEEGILAPTPQTDHSRNDEICTSQVDSSAIEDLPLRREDRKKSFMASTSDKTRNVQRKLRNQAGRLKSKFKEMQKPKQEDSPTSERKRFRSPEFNKLKNIKMPKISKPELKRPEFTKFTTPKFKKPDFKFDGFSSLRLNRKKSTTEPSESISGESKITRTTEDTIPTKKRFDFGTYPRIFDRMRRDNRSGASGTTISRDTEPDEECDRVNVSGPILFSTVPRSKKDKKPIRSKWASGPSYADDENSSGKFKHYSLDRESSIEKRMRFDFKDSIDAEDEDGERGILQTEEQKQYADYDKENRAIHQISQAKEGEFRQRKPLVHQESDVVSEESNKELGWVDTDHLRNRLMAQSGDLDISQKEDYVNEVLPDHLSTQETQSSGSSSNRRRKGVIEEIDDDEFFLRKKGISQDDIQIGKYISAAIREGLDTPVNALAQLAQYDNYYDEDFDISNERVDYGYDVPPRKPRRVRDFEKSLSSEFNDNSGMAYNDEADHDEDVNISPDGQFFQTYPPSRPRRKTRKQQSEESHDEHEVPVAAQYYPHTDDDEHSFYENKHMEGIEQPDIKITYNEDTNLDIDYTPNEGQTPPKAPKRRKHLLRESVERDSLANNFVGRSISNSYLTNENAEETVVFRTEHEYVPLVQPETFTTPTPTPRSRSKASPLTDDDRTSRGAESLAFDETKFSTDLKEVNGYAVVKKEPPPRPPAPIRRKRSTRSLGDRQFFTMPLRRNQNDLVPERPVRNYSTIGPTRPIRPARRVSLNSLEKPPSITSDATQYEEIEDINHLGSADHRDNKTDQNYKMKHRPLPPPPRPPRERKHRKSSESDGNKLDKDGGGEKITSKNLLEDISRISSQDMEEIEEMERSTQTDPLPDDYLCEEFDINSDMPIIEPSFHRHSKTLEDILKEEQQAEMERARQIADENSLTKGIQKFREANQRSLSERSRGSTNDRPKTPSSRPITPSAVIIEKKTNLSTIETDAQLIVQPVDEDEVDTTTNISHRNRFFAEDTVDTEDERIVNEALKRYNLLDSDFRDSSPQRDIELNIREVEPPNQTQTNEVPQIPLEAPPQAPPRRKSSCTESTVVPIANENENVPIPEEDHADIESHSATMNLLPGNRLHINELEVEHLNVHDLQAGRILVSDLQAIAMSSQDIECTSGDLIVKGIKLPPGFLEELINRARTSAIDEHPTEHETSSQLVQESNQQTSNVVPLTEQNPIPANEQPEEPEPPARPPPPRSLYPSDYAPYSLPPPSFYQLRSYPDEIEEVLPHSPTTMHRQRRRYHRRRDSTSEEEEQREHRRSRQHSNRSPEPSIGDLSGQLMRACGSAIGRGGVKLYALMKERKQEMKRRDISIGVAILIFVVAFLMMIGIRGERTVHHHHWDYWNPPGSSGRP